MFITLQKPYEANDGSKPVSTDSIVIIPVGRHEVDIVNDPYGVDQKWIVLKGTLIGGCEQYWKGQKVVIEE